MDRGAFHEQDILKATVMRKILFSILLASVAASPAFAQDHENDRRQHGQQQQEQQGDRGQTHVERQQVRNEGRAERSNGGGNFVRQQTQGEAQGGERSRFQRVTPSPQEVAPQQQAFDRGYRGGHNGFSGAAPEGAQQAQQNGGWRRERDNAEPQRSGGPGVWTRTQNGWARGGYGDLRQGDRPDPNVMRTRNPMVINNNQRESVQSQYRDRSRLANGSWNRDWRNDRRYDWRRYRDGHRSIFHIGVYFDPFGYGYQPFDIGYRLVPAYYGQQYWIDPATYSLPYPPPGTQWVRYWNDALLIDVYSGEVVDVIHNFFW